MASSGDAADVMPGNKGNTSGKPITVGQKVIDMAPRVLQSLQPINNITKHSCTFAFYSHDPSRQIEVHHYFSRLNHDFYQSAVYDSDQPNSRLIGVEYIVSERIFKTLDPEEQRLWHSHAHEIMCGFWMNPGVPWIVEKSELQDLVGSYGKFWCTWQVDRGDPLPMGAPALMMSPRPIELGAVNPDLIRRRDEKYGVSTSSLKTAREGLKEPKEINPSADNWKQTGKGFALHVVHTKR